MSKILAVIEDIKQNITDNQYKTIMDSLMEIHRGNNEIIMVINYHYYPIIKNVISICVCLTG